MLGELIGTSESSSATVDFLLNELESYYITSTTRSNLLLNIGLSIESKFGLLYHAGKMGWDSV